MIVVDVNILAFYVIEGQRTAAANALRDLDAEWLVPTFWCVEFQSILWKYVRQGGLSEARAVELLEQAMGLFSVNQVTPSPEGVLRYALTCGITVYDAQYVALAKQLGVRCVTEDVPVQKACPDLAISLEAFIAGRSGGGQLRESAPDYGSRHGAGVTLENE